MAMQRAISLQVENVRKNLGQFHKLKTVPKFMARMGQCFTQSQVRV